MKTDLRTALSSESVNSVLRIKLRGTSIAAFNQEYSDEIVRFWYNKKDRRIHQRQRKDYKKRTTSKKSHEAFDVKTFTMDIEDSASGSDSGEDELSEYDTSDEE